MPIEPVYDLFGSRLHRARLARGLTMAALADRVACPEAHIADIEAGRQRVTLHTAVRLAEAIGETLTDLTKSSSKRARWEALGDE